MELVPPFAQRLARLLEHRGTPPEALAAAAGVPPAALDAVLAGAGPDPALLRRIAPALGLHAADLLVAAGQALPDDLAPARLTGPWRVNHLVHRGRRGVAELLRRIEALPDRRTPHPEPWTPRARVPVPGEVIHRLLENRNIRVDMATLMDAGGPYLSTSTYAMALGGRTHLEQSLVDAFAWLLGIAPGDLVALAGVEPSARSQWPPEGEPVEGLAELAWAARRLDDEQLERLLFDRD
ncbi:hypothetical protein KZZ52_49640 [Dactylosporangium sp. AC04546]|uniref:hypothetical protein n=1 Tax=Dactylosporangium sp. AC04546 TaxID=2862460 RepID=UPI001EDED72A|nr:hypothetical protein [Dactylosporangium sp. AC04546]WVK81949.1 hypothetical protein KZZ52_49640 [Dactylosporangium sp. AC04546]